MTHKTPKSWNEVSLDKYIKLYNLYKSETDEIELTFKRLAIILDKTMDEIEAIPLNEYNEMKSSLEFLQIEPKQTKFKKSIKIKGVEYPFIDLSKLRLGDFVDLEFYQKDLINNMHNILSILYQQEGGIKPNPSDILQEIDAETALSSFFFIYLFGMNLLPSDMKGYSQLGKAVKEMKKLKKHLKKEKALQI